MVRESWGLDTSDTEEVRRMVLRVIQTAVGLSEVVKKTQEASDTELALSARGVESAMTGEG